MGIRAHPVVGITADVGVVDGRERAWCTLTYADAVVRAGGVPILLSPCDAVVEEQLALCDAVILTGGDDPRTEAFGVPTHPRATPLVPRRQEFELRLLGLLAERPRPTLGICLGMQLMALRAGGRLDQHMPDRLATAGRHWGADHPIVPEAGGGPGGSGRMGLAAGTVHSKHRQAVEDPGGLEVLARSDDGVIEAVIDPRREFYLGVQWHPERTAEDGLGLTIFRRLVDAARDGTR